LATIRNADLIFAIKDGEVVESGSHEELLQKHGYYAQLWALQARVFRGIRFGRNFND